MTTTTEHTPTGPDEPDWRALEAEILAARAVEPTPAAAAPAPGPAAEPSPGDAEAAAQSEADRQYQRWTAAARLRDRMFAAGASPAATAQALHESYPDIHLPGYTYSPAPAAPAEPVVTAEDAEDSAEDTEALEPLSKGLKWLVAGVVAAVLALAVLGFIVSFDTQTTAMTPYFGEYAPLVPLAIDLGIVVFAALNLVLARLNMSIMWLRAVPWVLTAMTLYINLSAHHELVAQVAHVALPGMWIVASEVGTHVLRIRAGLEAGTRTESLGVIRWLLDPVSTARLWRHMRLWGLKTAAEARASEAQRLEARAALHARYGWFWRVATPIQLRTAYRLRRLDAETVYTWTPPAIAAEDTEDGPKVASAEAVKDTGEDAGPSVLKDAAKDAPEDARKDGVKDTRKDVSEDAAKDAPEDARKDGREDATKSGKDTGAKRPRRPRKDTGAKRRGGTAVDPKASSDEELAEHLNTVVGPAETVSIRRAVTELRIGKDRASRVIKALEALRAQATV